MTEYMTIVEAARRAGVSDKTLRRAIHAGTLTARYPQPNRAEVALQDLEAWQASLVVRPGETEDRLAALEAQVAQLTAQVTELTGELAALRGFIEREPGKRSLPKPEDALPAGFTWLADFASQHFIPYQEAERLYKVAAIHGQKITVSGRRSPVAIGPKGRRDFWVQLHVHPDFRSCDDCPHAETS
jgi:excisionase family DNA binding protein